MAKNLSNILINTIHDRELKKNAIHLKGRLIDIGCGTKPYKALLAPYVTEHIGVDHEGSTHDKSNIDLRGTAYAIPASDASFDSALCTVPYWNILKNPNRPCVNVTLCSNKAVLQFIAYLSSGISMKNQGIFTVQWT